MGDSSQATNEDRSISWEMAEEVIGGQRCSCRAAPGSCRCDLPTAEGRKGAAARGEGRSLNHDDRSVERSNLSTFRPTRCRDLSAAERRAARRQRFVARAGRRHLLCPSAPLLLCVNKKPLPVSTCSTWLNKIKHSSTRQGQSVAGKIYTLLEFGTQYNL